MFDKHFLIEDINLMSEWDFDKNNEIGLNPNSLSFSSSKKAFWKCKNNHIYQTSIKDKVRRNQKCPICQNKIVIKGINDFETNYPELLRDWNYSKNKGIIPSELSLNSSKKVWWKCNKCKHEWQTTIAHRTIRKQSCPVCTNRFVKIGVNDLKTTNPSLAKEWNYNKNTITPEQITAGSHTKVWWICSKCGHEWQAQIKSRNNGCGCPECAKKYRKKPTYKKPRESNIVYEKSLLYLYPEIAKEWDYSKNILNPSQVGSHSKLKVWWKCSQCNYSYERQIRNITQRNNGCPKCSKIISPLVNIGVNDLKSQNPKLSEEFDNKKNIGITPETITVNSGRKVWWICPLGHSYQAEVRGRNRGSNCPICNKRFASSFPEQALFYYIKKAFPDAINKYTDVFNNAMELDIYIPSIKTGIEYDGGFWHNTEESHQRELKKYKVCKKNNIILIRIKEKTKNLCKDTADSIYIIENNSSKNMLERHIYHILSLIDIDSNKFFDNKNKPIFYNKVDINIERDKSEIYSYLSNIENSIAKEFPNLIEEWNYEKNGNLKPEMFSVGSAEKVWWKCKVCGHNWQAPINRRTPPRNSGCPKCAIDKSGETFHKNYIKKKGSLIDVNPKLAEEWHPTKNSFSIQDITSCSPKNVWWLCKKCGYEWISSPNNRSKGVGCPCCYGRVPKPGVSDLETLYPNIVKEWDYDKNIGIEPSMFKPGSGKKVWWKCQICGNSWQAVIAEKTKGRKKCPKCKNSQDK